MKSIHLFIFFLSFIGFTAAQNPYFQQQVDFRIDVKLDDQNHTITGGIEMDYTNNSPDELTFIYLHLWANAFSDRNTAFARQKVRQGSNKFYFAKDNQLGNYSGLNFMVDGQSAELKLLADNPDIAILTLPKALPSGGKVTIKSPFGLKIPASFSRLGHVGESYQMTQWYPKPAVYDREGWHQMPYLDMGEYYSEFGSYTVQITLPKNYVVAATGVLDTPEEVAFLDRKIKESNTALAGELPSTDDFPPSDSTYKTIRYTAEQVHDFAWFADKRFYVQKSEVNLATQGKVDTWAFFTNTEGELWKKGTFYVDRAVKFYSENVGEYPYPQATAVQSALSAGGGMEYPMITVIGLAGEAQALDGVITHEVGHNWFYGILAFDEREHPWLDEGLNSYYDHRYTEDYYEDDGYDFLPQFIMKSTDYRLLELAYLYQARRNLDQAPATSSDDYVRINYFLGAYEKPAVVIKYLEKYLGTDRFDRILKGFYEKWKFKHPSPTDFQEYLVKESGEELSWFFDGFLYSNKKFDYALQNVKQIKDLKMDSELQVTVRNKGEIDAPFSISGIRDSQIVTTQWYPGFAGKSQLTFPTGEYDRLVIDAERIAPDLYRQNNSSKLSGLFRTTPPVKIKFPVGFEHSEQTTVFATPLVVWNNYDKTMLGLALYNSPMPAKRFEYALAPMYSFTANDLSGLGNLQYHWYAGNKWIKQLTLDLGVKRFNYFYNWRFDAPLQYTKVVPALKLELGKKANSSFSHHLQYRAIILDEEREVVTVDSIEGVQFMGVEPERSVIHEVSYFGQNRRAVNPFSYRIAFEQQSYSDPFGRDNQYFKGSVEWNGEYTYNRNKSVSIRFFGGYFFKNNRRDLAFASDGFDRGNFYLAGEGYTDYKYDDLNFGRNQNEDLWSRQVTIRDGGFKNTLGSQKLFGESNDLLLAVNLKADLPQNLPFNIPLKPYLDLGYFNDSGKFPDGSLVDHFNWSGGIMLEWFNGNCAIYFPIVNSKYLNFLYKEKGSYLNRITYTINLKAFNPFEAVNNISF